MKISVFILLFTVNCTHSLQYEIPQSEIIKKGEIINEVQFVFMDENNPANTTIILISKNVSELTTWVLDGDHKLLNPIIRKQGEQYEILAEDYIDYEGLTDKHILFDVKDKNDSKRFNFKINNLDDNPPTISSSTPCKMKENNTIDISNTTCQYEVYDPDGFLNTMNFSFSNKYENMNKIFKFQYNNTPTLEMTKSPVFLVLQPGVLLDFEKVTLHIFELAAKDGAGHPTSPLPEIEIIVQVIDVPDEPPVWTRFSYPVNFDEEQEQTFQLNAKDGDVEINNKINYKINDTTFVSINKETGDVFVRKIDRDAGHDKISFSVTAYEEVDVSSNSTREITLYINDIDDNIPEIHVIGAQDKLLNLTIDENTYVTINETIVVNDIDLGDNALYSVELRENSLQNQYTSAFKIIPTKGYQLSVFSLIITNVTKLDYENPEWKKFPFNILSIGDKNNSHKDSLSVSINLRDINDEYPIFKENNYKATVPEDVEINNLIITVEATDKDEGDIVSYSILGSGSNKRLTISNSGEIRTKIQNAFNYKIEKESLIEIQAEDLAQHKTTTQLIITVLDVNNEDPTIFTTSSTISIKENQADHTVLNINITASDEDKTAWLDFRIIWEKSYATKNSERKDLGNLIKCIEVETVRNETNNHEVNARLSIKEVVKDQTPDYETYDTLFMYLEVKDNNTEHGKGTAYVIIIINIININDNPPIFTKDAINANRQVIENANPGSSVGSVIATDLDNLEQLKYDLKARNNTPDWIQIDSISSALTVNVNNIDCDDPPRTHLYYTVQVFDGNFTSSLNISIFIIDQNDNKPHMQMDNIEIPEDTKNGTIIYTFNATDKDRDAVFHDIEYSFQMQTSTDITNRFKIEGNCLKINLINDAILSRDTDIAKFSCRLIYKDNPTNYGAIQFTEEVDFLIILLDVNNKVPFVVTKQVFTRENLKKGQQIKDEIIGQDLDEKGTNNSKIRFSLMNIQKIGSNFRQPCNEVDLFSIGTDANNESQKAFLTVNYNLETCFGLYNVTIKTEDFGNPPLMKVNNFLLVEVKKFNFKPPVFIFPSIGNEVYYLKKDQNISQQLKLYNNTYFPNIKAYDQQDNKYNIKFKLVFNSTDDEIFKISNADTLGHSTGQLQLISYLFDDDRKYQFKIVADICSEDAFIEEVEASHTSDITIIVGFFDINSDPIFDYSLSNGYFTENKTGLSQKIEIKPAFYPNINIPNLSIYYLLMKGDANTFKINKKSGVITLLKMLDYEIKTKYELAIQATKDGLINKKASNSTHIVVDVQVIDVNDNIPYFTKRNFYGGIMTTYPRGTKIVEITAIDLDVHDKLKYKIEENTLETHGEGLEDVSNPFVINKDNGEVSLNFAVLANMKGYFTFRASVTDPDPSHKDVCSVKVFLITDNNCVNFKFDNTANEIQNKSEMLKEILNKELKYKSNIRSIDPYVKNGIELNNQSIASIYFINESTNSPINKDTIKKKVTDPQVFSRISHILLEHALILTSFNPNSIITENVSEIFKMWLIGVTVVLGAFCIIISVAFILKIKALSQRINNLSTTKFGSQESGLNRLGINAPTTNKHAIEGSNPIYKSDLDRISTASGDSDLIGVEDNPEFEYKN